MSDFHFINSMVLVAVVLIVFCFGIPASVVSLFSDAPAVGKEIEAIHFAGPNTFVPGLLAICFGGVALGVLAIRADRKTRGEE